MDARRLVVVLLLVLQACQSDSERAAELVREALPLMSSQPAEAQRRLEKAVRLAPDQLAPRSHLAKLHLDAGRYVEARDAAARALAAGGEADARVQWVHAVALLRLDAFDDAIDALMQVPEEAGEAGERAFLLGEAYAGASRRDDAVQAFEAALAAEHQPGRARLEIVALRLPDFEAGAETGTSLRDLESTLRAHLAAVPDSGPLAARRAELRGRFEAARRARSRSTAAGILGLTEGHGAIVTGSSMDLDTIGENTAGGLLGSGGFGSRPSDGMSGQGLGGLGLGRLGSGQGGMGPARGGDPVPRVRLLPPEVSPGVDASVIARMLRTRINSFRYCYETGLREDPTLAGTLTVEFSVNDVGRVSGASSSGVDRRVGQCMAQQVRRVRFPNGTPGTVTVRMTLATIR